MTPHNVPLPPVTHADTAPALIDRPLQTHPQTNLLSSSLADEVAVDMASLQLFNVLFATDVH